MTRGGAFVRRVLRRSRPVNEPGTCPQFLGFRLYRLNLQTVGKLDAGAER